MSPEPPKPRDALTPANPADETVVRGSEDDATTSMPVVPGVGEPSRAEPVGAEVGASESSAASAEPPVLVPPPPAGAPLPPAVPPAPSDGETLPAATPTPIAPPPVNAGQPDPIIGPPPTDTAPAVTAAGHPNPHGLPDIAVDRPEVAVGAAFAGGLVLAFILKRLGR